jgi:DNA-binding IclR family transcriptional regulator
MDEEATATIPTNLRLLLVIEEIVRSGVPVTPTDVNATLGLPKPTIHRLFATLEEEGFLQRDLDGRTYSPGSRLRTLASGVMSSLRIRTARLAVLGNLSREIGETCNIALPDRDGMIYLERVETEWPLRIQLPIGTRVPFYCTASGKVYLSSLKPNHFRGLMSAIELEPKTPNTITDLSKLRRELVRVRELGYALDREEFMPDMVALAVPILDVNSRIMATLAAHAPKQRVTSDKVVEFLEPLRTAASELGQLVTDE